MENKVEVSGLVIVNKEEGITSQGVVNRVKRIFGAAKAGHTGTLDPMATGVLPVLVGRAVKASEFMLTSNKHYGATLLLGVTTDTEDVTGTVLTEYRVSSVFKVAVSIVAALSYDLVRVGTLLIPAKRGHKLALPLRISDKLTVI